MRKLITTAELAEILGLKPNTLEIWRSKNIGPPYKKIGGRVLYDPEEIEDFIHSCTIKTQEDNSDQLLTVNIHRS